MTRWCTMGCVGRWCGVVWYSCDVLDVDVVCCEMNSCKVIYVWYAVIWARCDMKVMRHNMGMICCDMSVICCDTSVISVPYIGYGCDALWFDTKVMWCDMGVICCDMGVLSVINLSTIQCHITFTSQHNDTTSSLVGSDWRRWCLSSLSEDGNCTWISRGALNRVYFPGSCNRYARG